MKKILTTFVTGLVLVFLGGCDEKAADIDPQELLQKAFEKSFEMSSATFSAEAKVKIEDVEKSNGEINLTFEGKGENLLEFPPKLDYTISAKFDAENPEAGKITGEMGFAFKIIEKDFFAKISKIDFTGSPEMEAVKPFIQMFSSNWYKAPFPKAPESQNFIEWQKELQKNIIESYKKIITKNEILIVENLRESDSDFILAVKPNFDLILSQDFIENNLMEVLRTPFKSSNLDEEEKFEALAKLNLDEEIIAKLPEILETVKQVWKTGNFKLTLKIGKENRIAHSSILSGNLDLAELQKIIPEEKLECVGEEFCEPRELSGKIIFDITSTSGDWNQPQYITAPNDFVDFDPAMIFGMMSPTMGLEPTIGLGEPVNPEKEGAKKGKCGDGVCDEVEKAKGVCPADCIKNSDAVSRPR